MKLPKRAALQAAEKSRGVPMAAELDQDAALANFSRPSRDYSYGVQVPRTDALGYSQPSLRDFWAVLRSL